MKTLNASLTEAPTINGAENDLLFQRRAEMNALLNQRLANAVDLHQQMKQAYWNVKDPGFTGLPELFDKAARSVDTYVDRIAERIVQLGGIARGTVRVSAALSILDEYPLVSADGPAHARAVASALSTFGRDACHTINEATERNDAASADLFTEISRGIDQWLRFIEAHLEARK